jgi:hypothetical protein
MPPKTSRLAALQEKNRQEHHHFREAGKAAAAANRDTIDKLSAHKAAETKIRNDELEQLNEEINRDGLLGQEEEEQEIDDNGDTRLDVILKRFTVLYREIQELSNAQPVEVWNSHPEEIAEYTRDLRQQAEAAFEKDREVRSHVAELKKLLLALDPKETIHRGNKRTVSGLRDEIVQMRQKIAELTKPPSVAAGGDGRRVARRIHAPPSIQGPTDQLFDLYADLLRERATHSESALPQQLREFDERAADINKTLRKREKEVKNLWGQGGSPAAWPANKVLPRVKPPQTPWEVQDEDDAWPEDLTRRVPDGFEARVKGRSTYDEQFSDLMKRVPLLSAPSRRGPAGNARRPPAAPSATRGLNVTVHVKSALVYGNRGDQKFCVQLARGKSLTIELQKLVPFEKWSMVTSICPENVRIVPEFRWNKTSVLRDGVGQIDGWRDQVLALDASALTAAAREHSREHSLRYVVENWTSEEPTCHLYLYIME